MRLRPRPRGRELWTIGRLKPASAKRTDKKSEGAVRCLRLPLIISMAHLDFHRKRICQPCGLATQSSFRWWWMYFVDGDIRPAGRMAWSYSHCQCRFSWVIPRALLLMNCVQRNVKSHQLTEMTRGRRLFCIPLFAGRFQMEHPQHRTVRHGQGYFFFRFAVPSLCNWRSGIRISAAWMIVEGLHGTDWPSSSTSQVDTIQF